MHRLGSILLLSVFLITPAVVVVAHPHWEPSSLRGHDIGGPGAAVAPSHAAMPVAFHDGYGDILNTPRASTARSTSGEVFTLEGSTQRAVVLPQIPPLGQWSLTLLTIALLVFALRTLGGLARHSARPTTEEPVAEA